MGLFDTIEKEALGRLEGKNPLLDIALGLISNPQTGGLSGLVDSRPKAWVTRCRPGSERVKTSPFRRPDGTCAWK